MSNATNDQIKAVLLDAAKLVERGWCQGEFGVRGEDGEYCKLCSYGALWKVASKAVGGDLSRTSDLVRDARKAAEEHIGLDSLLYANNIATWNDAPERTQAEVVAALRGAAEGLGKEGGE